MTGPYESLLIKLWETLAEKGVGGLLRPWQIRRDGNAVTDVRCHEIRELAEAEREAEEIRAGRRMLCDGEKTISVTAPLPLASLQSPQPESERSVQQVVTASIVSDTLRKEINVAKAIINAEEELKNDKTPPPDKNIDPDWLYRWRDYAGNVSSDELQAMWGKILAGELKTPGSNSYRLLEFIRNLTKEDAEKIEKVLSLAFKDFIPQLPDDVFMRESVSLSLLLEVQELGIISGIGSWGFAMNFDSQSTLHYEINLFCNGKGLHVEHPESSKKLKLATIQLTGLGKQVKALGKFTPSENYLRAVGLHIKGFGFDVSLFDYTPVENDGVQMANVQKI